jgi:hypothetical protein
VEEPPDAGRGQVTLVGPFDEDDSVITVGDVRENAATPPHPLPRSRAPGVGSSCAGAVVGVLVTSVVMLGCGGGESGCVAPNASEMFGSPVSAPCDEPGAISRARWDKLQRQKAHEEKQLEVVKRVRGALAPVCHGAGVPQAAAKPTGKLALVAAEKDSDIGSGIRDTSQVTGGHNFEARFPSRSQPTTRAETYLVACFHARERTLKECRYGYGGSRYAPNLEVTSLSRSQWTVSVVIRVARNGARVGSRTFEAPPPPKCPEKIRYGTPSEEDAIQQRLYSRVKPAVIVEWLAVWREHPN